jgi:BirA family biotin operon repressor/biotin-[acetyl-CoA-carboxylase] ligase
LTERERAAPSLPPPFRLLAYECLDSTNNEAKRLAAAGAAHGTLIWAREQSGGRGRLDRSWTSQSGNLFMSVILRPDVPPPRAAELGFVASLAVADMVDRFVPMTDQVRLKWPNDVLVDGAKLAGILLEAWLAAAGPVEWVVLGIGVNVVAAPTGTAYPATALHAHGSARPDAAAVLETLGVTLADRIAEWQAEGFAPIRHAWLARARGLGEMLEIRHGGAPIAGRFLDLDLDGALVLETETGLRRVTAGDVHFPNL